MGVLERKIKESKHIMRLSTGSSREPIYEVDDRALSINIIQHATPPLG
jgi:hypothetical protein